MKDTKSQQIIDRSTSDTVTNINNLEDLQLALVYLSDKLGDRITELNTDKDGQRTRSNDDFSMSDYKAFKLARRHLALAVDALQLAKEGND